MFHKQKTVAALLTALLSMPAVFAYAQSDSAAANASPAAAPLPQEELDQVIAPIALYPDSLLSQVLMASTYPLEIVQADRFAKDNSQLKDDALAAALDKQPWDPSVKSLVNFPTVLAMMSDKLSDTIKLGDAFIADQKRVMDTVQQFRLKAQAQGNLQTTAQQTVVVVREPQTQVQVIQIQPVNPTVIYVPVYNPVVVYGPWPYPAYPPYYYRPPGYVAVGVIGFGAGFACGAAWGYAWGNCNWGKSNVNININQNYNYNKNINRNNYAKTLPANGAGNWQHNPDHRKGVAYSDPAIAKKYGGASSDKAVQARESYRGRSDAGRQDLSKGGADQFRGGGAADGNKPAAPSAGNNLPSRGGTGTPSAGNSGLPSRGGASTPGAVAKPTPAPNSGGSTPSGGATPRPAAPTARGGAFDGAGGGGSAARNASQQGNASRSSSSGSSGASRGSGGGAAAAGRKR